MSTEDISASQSVAVETVEFVRDTLYSGARTAMELDLLRLEELHSAWWQRALDGSAIAVNVVLKLLDARAKYLGLYAATGVGASVGAVDNLSALSPAELMQYLKLKAAVSPRESGVALKAVAILD